MFSITACSPRPRFGDFVISWTLQSFWIGENVCPARDVKPFLELFDVVHHLLVHVTHSSLPTGLQRRRCENCVIRTGLV